MFKIKIRIALWTKFSVNVLDGPFPSDVLIMMPLVLTVGDVVGAQLLVAQ